MKVIKHGEILAYIFYKKIKSLRKRSATVGPFGSALPPPMLKVFGYGASGRQSSAAIVGNVDDMDNAPGVGSSQPIAVTMWTTWTTTN
jgi:hypothetical protein